MTVGGKIHSAEAHFHPEEWLKQSMDKKVILKIIWPKLDSAFHHYKSYKIATRSQVIKIVAQSHFMLINNLVLII